MQDTVRGVERTRIWPEKRGSRQTKGQIDQQDWFRQANWAYKLMDPKSQAIIAAAAKGTSLYPRDVFSIMASGGLFWLNLGEEGIAHTMSTIQAVSESLDTITQKPGFTIIRGPQFWKGQQADVRPASLISRAILSAPRLIPGGAHNFIWDGTSIDELDLWDAATPERLTIPPNISRVSLGVNLFASGGTATTSQCSITKNGDILVSETRASGVSAYGTSLSTGPIEVEAGDYFIVRPSLTSPGNATLNIDRCVFWAQWA